MEKLLKIVQITGLIKHYELPEWARDHVTSLGGRGFVVRGQQFDWYDYVVQVDFYGVKGMKSQDINTMAHNGNVINSIERSCT